MYFEFTATLSNVMIGLVMVGLGHMTINISNSRISNVSDKLPFYIVPLYNLFLKHFSPKFKKDEITSYMVFMGTVIVFSIVIGVLNIIIPIPFIIMVCYFYFMWNLEYGNNED